MILNYGELDNLFRLFIVIPAIAVTVTAVFLFSEGGYCYTLISGYLLSPMCSM